MRRPARPDLRLDERDVGELDLDDHLVRPGSHLGHLGRLEHLRRAELPYHYRSHARPPSRNSSSPANEPKGLYRSAQTAWSSCSSWPPPPPRDRISWPDQRTGRRADTRPAFRPALPDAFAVRATRDDSRRAVLAACRVRQASDGFPAVSAAV